MSQRIKVTMVDDLVRKQGGDDVTADETVRFGLDGTEYEIDLTGGNAGALRTALEEYIGAARKIAARPARRRIRTQASLDRIREWARENNYDVKERGRVPATIVAAYEKAHSKEPASF